MKETKMEPVTRYYCDACGHEIKGNRTTYTFPSGKELHAHTKQECREIVSNMPESSDNGSYQNKGAE